MTASPTTSGISPSAFRPFSQVTYSGYRARVGAAPVAWGIPRTGDECDRVLDAGAATPNVDVARYLAGFMGAASHVWTPSRRLRLRTLLAGFGSQVVPLVLSAVAATPRQEVIDEAVDVLIAAASSDDRVIENLVHLLAAPVLRAGSGKPVTAEPPPVRATITRALGRTRTPATREHRLGALAIALVDAAPSVRDAAIQALRVAPMQADRAIALRLLTQRRAQEKETFLLEEIDDALADLRGE